MPGAGSIAPRHRRPGGGIGEWGSASHRTPDPAACPPSPPASCRAVHAPMTRRPASRAPPAPHAPVPPHRRARPVRGRPARNLLRFASRSAHPRP
ncbi:hypothetical protein E4P41_02625 [Geodermatophilus sp. DF01-2]|nr:hypothetical protein E4P41_02625 [Geodermatophilus sp. DF01_2]